MVLITDLSTTITTTAGIYPRNIASFFDNLGSALAKSASDEVVMALQDVVIEMIPLISPELQLDFNYQLGPILETLKTDEPKILGRTQSIFETFLRST